MVHTNTFKALYLFFICLMDVSLYIFLSLCARPAHLACSFTAAESNRIEQCLSRAVLSRRPEARPLGLPPGGRAFPQSIHGVQAAGDPQFPSPGHLPERRETHPFRLAPSELQIPMPPEEDYNSQSALRCTGRSGAKMAAGEEEGLAAEPEQEPAAEKPRSFKDLVRLGRSPFCPWWSLPCPEEQRPARPAWTRPGELSAGPTRAALRRGGAGPGQDLWALGRCPAQVGIGAPIAAPQPAAAIFKLSKLDIAFFVFYGHVSPLKR